MGRILHQTALVLLGVLLACFAYTAAWMMESDPPFKPVNAKDQKALTKLISRKL